MNEASQSKRPSHIIYQVIEPEGGKARWNKLGAAWLHSDGKGANLVFESFPVTGRVVLREFNDKRNSDDNGGQQ